MGGGQSSPFYIVSGPGPSESSVSQVQSKAVRMAEGITMHDQEVVE